ncbi:MAG TPA: hypothetical protein VGL33_13840 [Streptosporangiaceae bacterium]|jgi:hypothetical protein
MTDPEQPEADTWEQRQPVVPGDTEVATELAPEVDEADAIDQRRPVVDPDDTEDHPACSPPHDPPPTR